jgi:hypothetical protein
VLTTRTEMEEETRALWPFQLAQRRIKDVMEMPDPDAARAIRSIKNNTWQVMSNTSVSSTAASGAARVPLTGWPRAWATG